MAILRKEYRSIPEAIFSADLNVLSLFSRYYQEFFQEGAEHNFVAMFLNIIRDFQLHKIDEKMLTGLIHHSLFDHRTKKYHYPPHLWQINDLIALLHQLLDITWIQDSSDYQSYLAEVDIQMKVLVKKYSPRS